VGTFLQAITDGVLQGGVHGLMAVGLTPIFGVLDLWTHLRIGVFVGLLITIPVMFILGVAGSATGPTARSAS